MNTSLYRNTQLYIKANLIDLLILFSSDSYMHNFVQTELVTFDKIGGGLVIFTPQWTKIWIKNFVTKLVPRWVWTKLHLTLYFHFSQEYEQRMTEWGLLPVTQALWASPAASGAGWLSISTGRQTNQCDRHYIFGSNRSPRNANHCLFKPSLSRAQNLHLLASDSSWWLQDDFRMTQSTKRALLEQESNQSDFDCFELPKRYFEHV